MEKDEIYQLVKRTVADTMGLEENEIQMSSDFREDLGCDSISLSELIMMFEDKFGIRIEDQEAEKLRTVDKVVEYVHANQVVL